MARYGQLLSGTDYKHPQIIISHYTLILYSVNNCFCLDFIYGVVYKQHVEVYLRGKKMKYFYKKFSQSVFDTVCASTPFHLKPLPDESDLFLSNIRVGYSVDKVPTLYTIPYTYTNTVHDSSKYVVSHIHSLIFEVLAKKSPVYLRNTTPDAEESLGRIIADYGCDILIADTLSFASIFGANKDSVARLAMEVGIRFGVSVFLVDSNESTEGRIFLFKSSEMNHYSFGLGIVTESIVRYLLDECENTDKESYHTAYCTSDPNLTSTQLWFAVRGIPIINDDSYVVVSLSTD